MTHVFYALFINPVISINCSIFILDQYFDNLVAEDTIEIKIGWDRIKDKLSS